VPVLSLAVAFVCGAAVSLSGSWLLVVRLERVGERLGLTEGLLGMLAALAADAPEITSAVTALSHREQHVAAGVAIGSNVFNLAALLGLSTVIAGRIGLHRRVVLLGGAVGVWIAGACLSTVTCAVGVVAGLVLTLLALVPYVLLLAASRERLARLQLGPRWERWLAVAVTEEEEEIAEAVRPARGRPADAAVAAGALLVVVVASVIMEQAASSLGAHYGVPQIVTGALVLAAVTSLPNAVAAIYLAARGRGAATLSTALNSNAINVVAGLLIPAAVTGLGAPTGSTALVAAAYLGLTVLSLALAYRTRGLRRPAGFVIIAAYAAFVVALLIIT
jgi:cation:H+ antiporter